MQKQITPKEWDLIEKSQFYADVHSGDKLSLNGADTSRAMWNLVLSIRDVSLYNKGIKPHRFWKISNVKNYFGLTGSSQKVEEKLRILDAIRKGEF